MTVLDKNDINALIKIILVLYSIIFNCIIIFQSLDGFALALAADGRFLYISETVSIYLGLSQVGKRCILGSGEKPPPAAQLANAPHVVLCSGVPAIHNATAGATINRVFASAGNMADLIVDH